MTTRTRSAIVCQALAALALLPLGIAFSVQAADPGAASAPPVTGTPESATSATANTNGKK